MHSAYSSYKGTMCVALLSRLFNSDCVHIYTNKLISFSQNSKGLVINLLASVTTQTQDP
jgi:hypothetical protein